MADMPRIGGNEERLAYKIGNKDKSGRAISDLDLSAMRSVNVSYSTNSASVIDHIFPASGPNVADVRTSGRPAAYPVELEGRV